MPTAGHGLCALFVRCRQAVPRCRRYRVFLAPGVPYMSGVPIRLPTYKGALPRTRTRSTYATTQHLNSPLTGDTSFPQPTSSILAFLCVLNTTTIGNIGSPLSNTQHNRLRNFRRLSLVLGKAPTCTRKSCTPRPLSAGLSRFQPRAPQNSSQHIARAAWSSAASAERSDA